MKKSLFFLLLNFIALFLQAQEERSVPVTKALLKQIQADKSFVEALQVLEDTEASVNYSNLKQLTLDKNYFVVRFDIKDPQNSFDFKQLIFVSQNGKTFSYFDGKKAIQQTQPPKVSGCDWSDWTRSGAATECRPEWWCGKKHNKQATYYWETKSKKCSDGVVKIKSRIVKEHCGC